MTEFRHQTSDFRRKRMRDNRSEKSLGALSGRAFGWIGLLGGIGGAINAWLCYAKFPVPANKYIDDFPWHIIPAGAVHGAILAAISVGFAVLFWERRSLTRWVGLLAIGWLSGYLSYLPLNLSLFIPSEKNVFRALILPFGSLREALLMPYQTFGFVAFSCYFFLNICRQLFNKRLPVHLFIGILSGCVGSLWWWIVCEHWYLSLLHGTIWGALVGYGFWKTQQHESASAG